VVGAVEERHIDVFARDVLNRGIGGFAQSERFSRVGDHSPAIETMTRAGLRSIVIG
jgi:hypothetical protein